MCSDGKYNLAPLMKIGLIIIQKKYQANTNSTEKLVRREYEAFFEL